MRPKAADRCGSPRRNHRLRTRGPQDLRYPGLVRATLRSLLDPPLATDPAHDTAKLAWILRLRWIALGAQLVAIAPALAFELLEPPLLPLFVGVIALVGAFNLVCWIRLRRGAHATQSELLGQLFVDIGGTSVLLGLSGGAWNPLVPILFVHAGLGALILDGRLSLLFFGLLISSLVVLQVFSHIPPALEDALVPSHILFPAQLLVAMAFWFLTAWLSGSLTRLHQHFASLAERKTRIDRLRAVGALAAGLSHEIATPLNTAQLRLARLGRNEALADHPDVEAAREALERCEDVLRNMAGAPLRPDGLHLEVVDVDELVEEVCSSVAHVHEDAAIAFKPQGRGPRRALLPPVAFSQGLIALIENAVEAAGDAGPIDVVVRSGPRRVEVSVVDRGAGWPEVVRNHIGEPFVTTKPDGVGLGLYYVHSLVEAIGATFRVEDRAEGGAIAHIDLPALTGKLA